MLTLENNISIKQTDSYKKYLQSFFKLFVILICSTTAVYISYNLTIQMKYLFMFFILLICSFFTCVAIVYIYNHYLIFTKYNHHFDKLSIDDNQLCFHINSKIICLNINDSHFPIAIDIQKTYIHIQYASYYLCSENILDKEQTKYLVDLIEQSNKLKLNTKYSILLNNSIQYEISNSFHDKIILFFYTYKLMILSFIISVVLFFISIQFLSINNLVSILLLNIVIAIIWSLTIFFISTIIINKRCFGKGKKYHIEFKDNTILFFVDGYLIDVKDLSYIMNITKMNRIYKINTIDKVILLNSKIYDHISSYIQSYLE